MSPVCPAQAGKCCSRSRLHAAALITIERQPPERTRSDGGANDNHGILDATLIRYCSFLYAWPAKKTSISSKMSRATRQHLGLAMDRRPRNKLWGPGAARAGPVRYLNCSLLYILPYILLRPHCETPASPGLRGGDRSVWNSGKRIDQCFKRYAPWHRPPRNVVVPQCHTDKDESDSRAELGRTSHDEARAAPEPGRQTWEADDLPKTANSKGG